MDAVLLGIVKVSGTVMLVSFVVAMLILLWQVIRHE